VGVGLDHPARQQRRRRRTLVTPAASLDSSKEGSHTAGCSCDGARVRQPSDAVPFHADLNQNHLGVFGHLGRSSCHQRFVVELRGSAYPLNGDSPLAASTSTIICIAIAEPHSRPARPETAAPNRNSSSRWQAAASMRPSNSESHGHDDSCRLACRVSLKCPIGHAVDISFENWTRDLRTYNYRAMLAKRERCNW
jgi:hypothetical protein